MAKRIIGSRYELLERIGSGGMAAIWRARDQSLGRAVAVKLLHDNLAADPGFVERFRAEARHAAGLSHENVVAVYDTGQDDGMPYIVMELVEGRTLHDLLRAQGSLTGPDTVRIAVQILAALAHAHSRGLVHRDVKPGNVLLTTDGVVKVTDFGIAKALDATAALTQTGTLLGTAAYISPEQALGRPATELSDLYAVGCVMYECLMGRPPFVGDNAVAVAVQHQRAAVPPLQPQQPLEQHLEHAVMRALAKDPAERPQSADEMSQEIRGIRMAAAPTAVVAAPTVATATPGGAPTQQVPRGPGATEVIPGATAAARRPPKIGRAFGWAAIALLAGAVVWLAAAILSVSLSSDPQPSPTPVPTVRITPSPTRTPSPTTRPTAEPTPEPEDEDEETPEPTFPLDLPGLRGSAEPSPSTSPTASPTPTPTATATTF